MRELTQWLDVFHVRTQRGGISIDVSLAWCDGTGAWSSFINGCESKDGTHVEGVRAALGRVLAARLRTEHVWFESGLVAMVHVMLDAPRFGNPSRDWLANPEVREVVEEVVATELERYLDETPAMLDALLLRLEKAPRTKRRSARR